MLDAYCDWAANNPTKASMIFVVVMIIIVGIILAIAGWPRKLPPLDDTDHAGC